MKRSKGLVKARYHATSGLGRSRVCTIYQVPVAEISRLAFSAAPHRCLFLRIRFQQGLFYRAGRSRGRADPASQPSWERAVSARMEGRSWWCFGMCFRVCQPSPCLGERCGGRMRQSPARGSQLSTFRGSARTPKSDCIRPGQKLQLKSGRVVTPPGVARRPTSRRLRGAEALTWARHLGKTQCVIARFSFQGESADQPPIQRPMPRL